MTKGMKTAHMSRFLGYPLLDPLTAPLPWMEVTEKDWQAMIASLDSHCQKNKDGVSTAHMHYLPRQVIPKGVDGQIGKVPDLRVFNA